MLGWHASSAGSVESQLVRGQETPQIQGWRSCGYKRIEPAWTAGFTSRGREVLLASAFLVAERGILPTVNLEFSGCEDVHAALDQGAAATELTVHFSANGAELS